MREAGQVDAADVFLAYDEGAHSFGPPEMPETTGARLIKEANELLLERATGVQLPLPQDVLP